MCLAGILSRILKEKFELETTGNPLTFILAGMSVCVCVRNPASAFSRLSCLGWLALGSVCVCVFVRSWADLFHSSGGDVSKVQMSRWTSLKQTAHFTLSSAETGAFSVLERLRSDDAVPGSVLTGFSFPEAQLTTQKPLCFSQFLFLFSAQAMSRSQRRDTLPPAGESLESVQLIFHPESRRKK